MKRGWCGGQEGLRFRVVVVDARPGLEGRELLRRLLAAGISATYVHINSLAYVMPEITQASSFCLRSPHFAPSPCKIVVQIALRLQPTCLVAILDGSVWLQPAGCVREVQVLLRLIRFGV